VSEYFDEEDYIRDHDVFATHVRTHQEDQNDYPTGPMTLEKIVTISQRRQT